MNQRDGHPATSRSHAPIRWRPQRTMRSSFCLLGCALCLAVAACGCATATPKRESVAAAAGRQHPPARRRDDAAADATAAHHARAQQAEPPPENPSDRAIATVDGRAISRERLVNLLLRSHGPGLIEQLIVLEAARQRAAQRGIVVSQRDLTAEYERSLRQLSESYRDPVGTTFDRGSAEAMLNNILAERNVSRAEYLLSMERNAYLRKLAEADIHISESELKKAWQARTGPRVQVRHIQLASAAEAGRVRDHLRMGEDFAALAKKYSANTVSAARGGLLEPFTRMDARLPALLRDAAFKLKAGEVSDVLAVGSWYHILRVETHLPGLKTPLAAMRAELEAELREEIAEPKIRELYDQLFRESDIRILDPALRSAFRQKHPEKR